MTACLAGLYYFNVYCSFLRGWYVWKHNTKMDCWVVRDNCKCAVTKMIIFRHTWLITANHFAPRCYKWAVYHRESWLNLIIYKLTVVQMRRFAGCLCVGFMLRESQLTLDWCHFWWLPEAKHFSFFLTYKSILLPWQHWQTHILVAEEYDDKIPKRKTVVLGKIKTFSFLR